MPGELDPEDRDLFDAFHSYAIHAAAGGAQPTTQAFRQGLSVDAGAIVRDPITGQYGVVSNAERQTVPVPETTE